MNGACPLQFVYSAGSSPSLNFNPLFPFPFQPRPLQRGRPAGPTDGDRAADQGRGPYFPSMSRRRKEKRKKRKKRGRHLSRIRSRFRSRAGSSTSPCRRRRRPPSSARRLKAASRRVSATSPSGAPGASWTPRRPRRPSGTPTERTPTASSAGMSARSN